MKRLGTAPARDDIVTSRQIGGIVFEETLFAYRFQTSTGASYILPKMTQGFERIAFPRGNDEYVPPLPGMSFGDGLQNKQIDYRNFVKEVVDEVVNMNEGML